MTEYCEILLSTCEFEKLAQQEAFLGMVRFQDKSEVESSQERALFEWDYTLHTCDVTTSSIDAQNDRMIPFARCRL